MQGAQLGAAFDQSGNLMLFRCRRHPGVQLAVKSAAIAAGFLIDAGSVGGGFFGSLPPGGEGRCGTWPDHSGFLLLQKKTDTSSATIQVARYDFCCYVKPRYSQIVAAIFFSASSDRPFSTMCCALPRFA